MLKSFVLSAALSLAVICGAQAQQITGRYNVDGVNPNQSKYEGLLTVEKTGENTYRVTWSIEGTRYVGTGIGNDDVLAIAYRSGNNTGIALAAKEGRDYTVVWTYAGGTEVGVEQWRRR